MTVPLMVFFHEVRRSSPCRSIDRVFQVAKINLPGRRLFWSVFVQELRKSCVLP